MKTQFKEHGLLIVGNGKIGLDSNLKFLNRSKNAWNRNLTRLTCDLAHLLKTLKKIKIKINQDIVGLLICFELYNTKFKLNFNW